MTLDATWYKAKRFFGRLGSFLFIWLRIYSTWSKVYQWLFQRKYRSPLLVLPGFAEITKQLHGGSFYRADGIKELGDAISHPEYSQWVLDHGYAPMGFDCDDHAIYIVAAANKSMALDRWADSSVRSVKFMTVTWIDDKGKLSGHNVALIEYRHSDWWSTFTYMDYDHPQARRILIEDVLEDIRAKYGGIGAESLGWALHDENLKVLEVHWK